MTTTVASGILPLRLRDQAEPFLDAAGGRKPKVEQEEVRRRGDQGAAGDAVAGGDDLELPLEGPNELVEKPGVVLDDRDAAERAARRSPRCVAEGNATRTMVPPPSWLRTRSVPPW